VPRGVELVETNGRSDLDKLDHPVARSPGSRPARGRAWTDEGEATKERAVPRVVELVETDGRSDLDKLDHPVARSPGGSITR